MSKVLLLLKEIGTNQKNGTLLKACAAIVIIAVLTTGIYFNSYSDNVNKGLADNLIRLHVIANSDSEEDQAIKIEVRDRILSFMRDELKDTRDIEETKYIINRNIERVESIANDEAAKHGKNYPIKATLGTYPFPTKYYGDIVLPSGYYDALKVVIGEGEGTNWWCVLFPPLCFIDAAHGTVSDSVKEELKNALTAEEYKIIASADNDNDIPIRIKFKVVEFFQDSKIKFSGIINRLFK